MSKPVYQLSKYNKDQRKVQMASTIEAIGSDLACWDQGKSSGQREFWPRPQRRNL